MCDNQLLNDPRPELRDLYHKTGRSFEICHDIRDRLFVYLALSTTRLSKEVWFQPEPMPIMP